MRKVRLEVYGKVQGVGFRFLSMLLAKELEIYGQVSNKADGSVYIEAMGENEKIETFINKIKASLGNASRVDEVIVREDDSLITTNKFVIR